MKTSKNEPTVADYTAGKSEFTLALLDHFLKEYRAIGEIEIYPTKSMIGIAHNEKRIAWITQLGKNFVHIVFPFLQPYPDNLCFTKIAQVPGQQQFNHHFRMLANDDVNEEVRHFMQLAYNSEQS